MIGLYHQVVVGRRPELVERCPEIDHERPRPDYHTRAAALGGQAPRCRHCGAALVKG